MNYFSETGEGPSIIAKEEVLLPDYVPDSVLYRHSELQEISDSIKPMLKKHRGHNLFIHGPSGTGKTLCIKYLIEQLEKHSSSVLPVYVNCWKDYTRMAVYNRITEKMKLPLPRRGLATDEIFDRITSYMENYEKPVMMVLDEMDGLKSSELLYSLGRTEKVVFGIIGISNDKRAVASLDARIRSSLRFSTMEFREYSSEQLFGIIRGRAERGLVPGSYNERILKKIAQSIERGSARIAIEVLWKSARIAEKKEKKTIDSEDLEKALENLSFYKKTEHNLSEEEKLIIEILENGPLKSKEIYRLFSEKMKLSDRQIRNYLDLLEKKKIIKSEKKETPGKFSSKKFSLRK